MTWTFGWALKGATLIGALMWWGILALQFTDPTSELEDFIVISSVNLVISAAAWAAVFRPRVCLTDCELIVRNPIGKTRIALTAIRRLSPGYSGLEIECLDGHRATAWVLGKDNISLLLRRETRADRAAVAIAQACSKHSSEVDLVLRVRS